MTGAFLARRIGITFIGYYRYLAVVCAVRYVVIARFKVKPHFLIVKCTEVADRALMYFKCHWNLCPQCYRRILELEADNVQALHNLAWWRWNAASWPSQRSALHAPPRSRLTSTTYSGTSPSSAPACKPPPPRHPNHLRTPPLPPPPPKSKRGGTTSRNNPRPPRNR